MGWHAKISEQVRRELNALCASGRLSRRGLVRAYNAVRIDLPKYARQFRAARYVHDPDYFTYSVGFMDRGVWRSFVFYVNDVIETGRLVVEDVDYGGA